MTAPVLTEVPSGPDSSARVGWVWLLVTPLAAFPLTMVGLLRASSEQTPQAYVGLVPFVVLAVLLARPDSPARSTDRRSVIAMLGLAMGLVLLAGTVEVAWRWRTDTLAIAVAGGAAAVALGRGSARWWCTGLGLFAWIGPYDHLLTPNLERYASVTVGAMDAITSVTGLADRVPGTSLFHLPSGGDTQTLDVAVSCSGINGAVAMVLIGLAVAAVARGSWRRRIGWVVVAVAAQWLANVLRIIVLFAITRWISVDVAIDVVHPIIGLVFFNLVVLVMVGTMPRWKLDLPPLSRPLDPGQRIRSSALVLLAACNLTVGSAAWSSAGVQPPEASTMSCPDTAELNGQARPVTSAAPESVEATCTPYAGSAVAQAHPVTGQ